MKVELTEVGNFANERLPTEIGSQLIDSEGNRVTPLSSMNHHRQASKLSDIKKQR